MSSYMSRYIGADRLPRKLSEFDLDIYFRLPAETVASIAARFQADRRPGVESRKIAMAAQVVFLRSTGRPLDNVALLPPVLLRALGAALQVHAPTIASLRSIYKRRETASEHQLWARRHLEIQDFTKDRLRQLADVLAAQAGEVASIDELVTASAHWLFDKRILIPADRTLRDLARSAFAKVDQEAARVIRKEVPIVQQQACRKALFARRDAYATALEWLKTPPRRHSPSTLEETAKKVAFLKELRADTWKLNEIPLVRQRAYAHAIARRPPSESRRRKDETQLLEVICFLRATLLELTDSVCYQVGRRVSDFQRQAGDRTQSRQAVKSVDYRVGLVNIRNILTDRERTLKERIAAIEAIIAGLGDLSPNTQAAVVREALTEDTTRIRNLLSAVSCIEFEGADGEPVLTQLALVRELEASGQRELPPDQEIDVPKVWADVVNGPDRKRGYNALTACVALELQRKMLGGRIWVRHSLRFREREEMLIPRAQWECERSTYLSALNLPSDPDDFLTPLLENIDAGLAALVEASKDGAFTIDTQGSLHLAAIDALPEELEPKRVRNLIFEQIGSVQFPDLILEVDAATNFSEILLGRRAKDEHELVAVYAALLSHGTEIDAKSTAAMIPQLDPGDVSSAMRALEWPGRLQAANRRLVEFQRQHALTDLWGSGTLASSDMMSIDATRNLWNARVDPRRRTYAVGVYTHVLDNHGICHNQPVVLNTRQAGPAIEGVVQHNRAAQGSRLKRLAVDTHGYTYAGMSIAKLQGFDLCPQLRALAERKLFLPRGIDTPDGLEQVTVADVSLGAIRDSWDELLRVAASIFSGRATADVIMARLGSAARGDPVHRAADQLGRLLRTLFLCDYFSNPEFRREIHTVLNRGESVHQLQRSIYYGRIAPARGRRRDELNAISGAHTLLTNTVIAWNTHRMQQVVDRWRKTGQVVDDAALARMGPAHFSHINFRGLFRFGIERYRELLLGGKAASWRVA